MARVGLVFGGRSVEHEVSMDSARAVSAALGEAGHEVVPLGVTPEGCWLDPGASAAALEGGAKALAPAGRPVAATLGVLLEAGIEVAFPLIHGTWGEDGTLQGLFEILDLPYAGAGVTASAVAMDKILCKRVFLEAGVPVVEYGVVLGRQYEADPAACLARLEALPAPLFVKPSVGGSSVGVQAVDDRSALAAAIELALGFDDAVLVERGVAGRELECSVLGYRSIEASAVGEIVPGARFYDYADKYLNDAATLIAPAKLEPRVEARIRELSIRAFEVLGGWGMARVDFLLEGDDRVFVNEINTIPGFTRISMYPKLWHLSGVPMPALVDRLVSIALERHRDRHRLDQGIHAWLADLHRTTTD